MKVNQELAKKLDEFEVKLVGELADLLAPSAIVNTSPRQ
jgi:hypothetical protein